MATLYTDADRGNFGAPAGRTNDSIFLEQELEAMLPRVIEDVRPELEWETTGAPIASDAGPGALTISWKEISTGGRMAPNNGSLADVPKVTAKAKKKLQNTLSFIIGAGWTNQEMRAAQMGNASLTDVYVRAAVRAYRETANDMYLFGSEEDGVKGLLTHDAIPRAKSTVTITDAAGGSSASDVRDALLSFLDGRAQFAKESFMGASAGKVLVLPSTAFRAVRKLILDATNRITVKREVEEITGVRIVEGMNLGDIPAAKSGLGAAYNIAFVTDINPENGQLHIPMPLMEVEGGVRHNGVEYLQLWEAVFAGFTPYQPRRHAILYGV